MCISCGNPFDCRYNNKGSLQNLLILTNPIPTMSIEYKSIEDKKFIVMQVGCNNLLGVFDTWEEALDMATKWAKKNIVKLHIFELHSTVESENKVEITQVKS